MNQGSFYDDLADYYDLIYADWEGSMRRHGAAIAALLGDPSPSKARILDVAAGIGTQSLALAGLGHEVVARDSSPQAIGRLRHEAEQRGLDIDAATSDMRDVDQVVTGQFDAVIAFDNAIPHLLSDADIVTTFRTLRGLLAPRGVVLISVRDYEHVDRSPRSVHPYGERIKAGRRFRLAQEWEWYDPSHYRTTMVIEEADQGQWRELMRTTAAYYAVTIPRLLALMDEAGLTATRVEEVEFFQPILRGRAG